MNNPILIIHAYDPHKLEKYLGDHTRRDIVERALAKNSSYALRYALEVLNGPFPLGEPAIFKDSQLAVSYVIHVLKHPLESLEVDLVNRAYQEDADTLRNYLSNIRDIRQAESLPTEAHEIERSRTDPMTVPEYLIPMKNYLRIFIGKLS